MKQAASKSGTDHLANLLFIQSPSDLAVEIEMSLNARGDAAM